MQNIPKPSCYTCKHCASWDHPASQEDPGDSGWECNHPIERNKNTPEELEHLDDDQLAIEIAAQCPAYEYQAPEPDYEPEYDEPTEAEIAAQIEASEAADLEHAIKMGWYDPTAGEYTNEYFAASDRAYDMRR